MFSPHRISVIERRKVDLFEMRPPENALPQSGERHKALVSRMSRFIENLLRPGLHLCDANDLAPILKN